MGKKPKTHRWNRWAKEEEKLRKLREKLQPDLGHATEEKQEEPKTPPKLNREKIAYLIVKHLREDPEVKKLAEELAHKLLQKILPELTARIIAQMVEIIHREVLKGATVEIRGLATWRTRNGKIKVKNHIKPKQTHQP